MGIGNLVVFTIKNKLLIIVNNLINMLVKFSNLGYFKYEDELSVHIILY